MEVERLCKVGTQLGLQGETLREWVEKQMKDEEEKKRVELEGRREERAAEQADREERQRELELKMELLSREAEVIQLRRENATVVQEASASPERIGSNGGSCAKAPRLPPFDEERDEIDAYLLRFERYAEANGWRKENWASHLSALLKSKSLETYSRLTEEEAGDYERVKLALLKRHNLTAEGFARKFRVSRPAQGEQMSQFQTRLRSYVDKWLHMTDRDKLKAEDVIDMFLQEQLLETCSPNLKVFVKERNPKSSSELVELTELYTEAHGTTGAFSKPPETPKNNNKTEDSVSTDNLRTSPRPLGTPSRPITCNNCGGRGHIARFCVSKKQTVATVMATVRECTFCRKIGHTYEHCWQRKRGDEDRKQRITPNPSSAWNGVPCEDHTKIKLNCGCAMPVFSAACIQPSSLTRGDMPVVKGHMDGKEAEVLRDSGCSGVVVKKSLVDWSKQKVERFAVVRTLDGRNIKAKVADVYLDCPFYVGRVKAVALETPLFDVILGNIPGAKCPGMTGPSGGYRRHNIAAGRTESAGQLGRKWCNVKNEEGEKKWVANGPRIMDPWRTQVPKRYTTDEVRNCKQPPEEVGPLLHMFGF